MKVKLYANYNETGNIKYTFLNPEPQATKSDKFYIDIDEYIVKNIDDDILLKFPRSEKIWRLTKVLHGNTQPFLRYRNDLGKIEKIYVEIVSSVTIAGTIYGKGYIIL